eukprot:Skav202103  [mRNA]  locus=scaffold1980:54716:56556:+ [translate_table: standard]
MVSQLVYSLGKRVPVIPSTAWVAPGARVIGDVRLGHEVGDRTNIQDLTMIHLDKGCPCIIGKEVSVGHSCILHGCTIEDQVLIGMGATVLNRAVIGRGSVIGAGALVLEGMEVPPFSLVVGSPAKVKKTYAEEDRMAVQQQHAESYVQRAALFRSELQEVKPLSKKLSPLLLTAAVFIGMACLSKIK